MEDFEKKIEIEKEIEKLKYQIDELEVIKDDMNQLENFDKGSEKELNEVEKKIKILKEKLGDIYEENIGYRSPDELNEDMLDMMFPDRHDDDFDEDSIS